MNKLNLFLTVGFALIMPAVFAQNIPTYEIRSYRDSSNRLYWNKNQEVFISLSPTRDGKREVLESEISKDYTEPFYFDTEGLNYIRSHWAVDKTTKKTVYPQKELLWEVYADGKAPTVKASFLNAPSMIRAGVKIYGRNAGVKLTADDETSGVQALNYSLDGANYEAYKEVIRFDKEGEHTIKYFAVDNVGNVSKIQEKTLWVDITPPSTTCTITGVNIGEENIISAHTRIYLEASDGTAGLSKTYWYYDEQTPKLYTGQNLPLNYLEDGRHTLYFYSTDKVNNKEELQSYKFYLDKTAPITASDVLGDRFIVGDQIYFSGRTKLKLTAVDNKSGVKSVMYSVDGSEFKNYDDPFYLPNKQGFHVVKYYALDNTDNTTSGDKSLNSKYLEFRLRVDKIYVDLTGPTLGYNIIGKKFRVGDTVFIAPDTKLSMWAKDGESGLHYIAYSIDGEQKENEYKGAFSITGKSGIHKVEYFAYDNVNNRNIDEFKVFLDSEGPDISSRFSVVSSGTKRNLDIYPAYASLFISVQDELTGISKILYSINGKPYVVYKNYIEGFRKNRVNTINIKAYDKLGNQSTKEIKFFAR